MAQRSAEAAKQINAIISSAGQRVEAGVKLVDETGAALGRIIDHVAQLSTIINEISAAAKEQAAGMNEVNSAVSQTGQSHPGECSDGGADHRGPAIA